MHLMVAGCSFSAVSKTHPGTAWSEVLAKKLGWRLTNLARQGCSNGGIRVQMDEIRRQRPDFAIIGPTFWDRMEIPADSVPYGWSQAPSSGENPPLEQHLQNRKLGNGYRREDGIRNVNYGREPSNMICETIFTLAENYEHPYRMGRITKSAQIMMYLDGIKFIVLPNLLWPFDPDNQAQWRQAFPNLVPDQYINLESSNSLQSICGNNPFTGEDPGYHSSPAGQEIIAEHFSQHWLTHFK